MVLRDLVRAATTHAMLTWIPAEFWLCRAATSHPTQTAAIKKLSHPGLAVSRWEPPWAVTSDE